MRTADAFRLESVPRKSNVAGLLIMLALAALILIARLHTYAEPLERDITTYALIGHELLHGKTLYSDVWDHKPPAIHTTFAVAELIAGFGRNSILLLNVAAGVTTLVGCYFVGRRLSGRQSGGILAAAIWAVACGDLGLEANQPNTEVFINAFLTTGFAVFLWNRDGQLSRRTALISGLLFALASLYKQIAVVPVALACLAYIATTGPQFRKTAIAGVVTIATVGALVWGLVFAYFTVMGRSDAFIDAVFIYNRAYAGDISANLARVFAKPALLIEPLLLVGLLALLTLLGVAIAIVRGRRREPFVLIAWMIGSHLAVLLPGQFFAHYYQLWLPPLVAGAAWGVMLLLTLPGLETRSWMRYLAPGAVLAGLIAIEAPYYFLPAEAWSFRKYGPVFVETERVAADIDRLLQPNETFYEWGSETGLYFATRRTPPTGLFFADPLLTGPLRADLWLRVAADLDRTKPDLVVLEKSTVKRTPPAHPVLGWVKQEYRPISKGGMFLILARKGSRLDIKQAKPAVQRPGA